MTVQDNQPPFLADGTDSADEVAPLSPLTEPKEHEEEQSSPVGLVFLGALGALLWFGAGPTYFLVAMGLMVMIFLHELGHYLTAKWTGMKVTQFFLFMGPRIWSFRRGEVEYGIRSLPVGAFVRIVGMHNLDPPSAEDAPRAYMNKSYPQKMLVITAGSMMHFMQALILFIVLSSVIGLADPDRWTIAQISQLETGETPAVEAGLEPGDTITAIDGVASTNWTELRDYVRARPGQEVVLTVETAAGVVDERVTTLASLTDERTGDPFGFLGVGPQFANTRESPLVGVEIWAESFVNAFRSLDRFVSLDMYSGLVQAMGRGAGPVDIQSEEAERPISMVGVVRIAGEPDADLAWPITLLAVVNIFVGIVNLLPLLPLDGGHAAVATYERLRSRNGKRYHMDVGKLMPLTWAVVAFMGFLGVTTVYLDIFRPIG
jgi:membrane-associated protease RseP (regulator of RpoE activity)